MARTIDLAEDWDCLVAAVLGAAEGRRLVVLLDGGSGAGKTTLAHRLRTDLQTRLGTVLGMVQLVSLDDAYPGWHGLQAASDWVRQTILRPHAPGHPTWDWQLNRTSGWVSLDPEAPIIVEGCGALSRQSAPLASTRIWYEMDAGSRRDRALGRDGEGYRPWWQTWAEQEAVHWAANRPWELADLIVCDAKTGKSHSRSHFGPVCRQ